MNYIDTQKQIIQIIIQVNKEHYEFCQLFKDKPLACELDRDLGKKTRIPLLQQTQSILFSGTVSSPSLTSYRLFSQDKID